MWHFEYLMEWIMSDQKDGNPHFTNQRLSKLSLDGFILLYIPTAKRISALSPLTPRLCLTGGVETESPEGTENEGLLNNFCQKVCQAWIQADKTSAKHRGLFCGEKEHVVLNTFTALIKVFNWMGRLRVELNPKNTQIHKWYITPTCSIYIYLHIRSQSFRV